MDTIIITWKESGSSQESLWSGLVVKIPNVLQFYYFYLISGLHIVLITKHVVGFQTCMRKIFVMRANQTKI